MLALRNSLAQVEHYHIYFSVFGDNVADVDSKKIEIDIVTSHTTDYFQLVRDFIKVNHIKVFIMDFHKSTEGPELVEFFIWAKAKGVLLVAIARHEAIPSWQAGENVLVMTGGADVLNLGAWLPELLDAKLMPTSTVNWIKGPYANYPSIPINANLAWNIHENPKDMDKLISQSSYVLTQFGVSFFESVQYGIPTVVVPLNHLENSLELDLIKKEEVALVANDAEQSVNVLVQLMKDNFLAKKLSNNSKRKMHLNGCDLLINKINKLVSC
jgi:UDP-N-acetylglucosamine:LPS N-acetylglucosamine transferase